MLQLIGKDEGTKETGDNQDHKGEWPKDPGTPAMHASTVDRLDTMPETVHKNKDVTPSPILLTLTTKNQKKPPRIE